MSALPSWARVGAKVVCVNNRRLPFSQTMRHLVVGAEYEIRETLWHRTAGKPAIRLVEFPEFVCFWVGRFRPLITIETDIATHFSALLDVREPEGV